MNFFRGRPRSLVEGVQALVAVALLAGTGGCVALQGASPAPAPVHTVVTWPQAPPVHVCGNKSILDSGPRTAPRGAVVVPAGDNESMDFSRARKTFWFAPGIHTLGTDQYSQIMPANYSRYVGAPGAVLDGQRINRFAFTMEAKGVTIEYLTIQHFGPVGTNNNEGVVNQSSGADWTIRYNTIRQNAGAGMMLGSGNVVEYNCVTRNGQYAFNAYSAGGSVDITMNHNEFSYNNTDDWERKIDGCGCTGGGKFWSVTNATVRNNYVHDNKGVGIWADNNNRGFLIENNYVSQNDDVGILYELSYNAAIRNNAIVRNGIVEGPKNPSFPTGGIYISESGADKRVRTRYSNSLDITGNLLSNNWSGVVLWENADRYCGSPAYPLTDCTLVNPRVVRHASCNARLIHRQPFFADCRWKTKNVDVHGNTFEQNPTAIGPRCTFARSCGVNAIFSNWGSYPDWSPYKARTVQKAITYRQNNRFYDNVYKGPWRFLPYEQGNLKNFDEWRTAPYRQDPGSTLTGLAETSAPRP